MIIVIRPLFCTEEREKDVATGLLQKLSADKVSCEFYTYDNYAAAARDLKEFDSLYAENE